MYRTCFANASPKQHSEDRATVINLSAGIMIAVADGAGGMAHGARAAETVIDLARKAPSWSEFDAVSPGFWSMVLSSIDSQIVKDGHGGETTGIVLAVTRGMVIGASCGDSCAWLLNGSDFRNLTCDQRRKIRLGSGEAIPIPFASRALGYLVVATDGLFNYLSREEIQHAIFENPIDPALSLIHCLHRKYRILPDDVAVVVVELDRA